MRVNRQLHAEVAKYFYENRTLSMFLAHDRENLITSKRFVQNYHEVLSDMNPTTRQLFTKLQVQLSYPPPDSRLPLTTRRYQHVPCVGDPMHRVLALLPNLTTITISTARDPPMRETLCEFYTQQMNDVLAFLLSYIPREMDISWDLSANPRCLGKWLADNTKTQGILNSWASTTS